jgi:serine protease Do
VRIGSVAPGGPADRAGLTAGDIVVSINGQPVPNQQALAAFVSSIRPGEPMPVVVDRAGRRFGVSVTLARMPDEVLLERVQGTVAMRLGLRIAPPPNAAIVAEVWVGSPADRAGLEPGMTIQRAGAQVVAARTDVYSGLLNAGLLEGRPVELIVLPENSGVPTALTISLY